MEGRLVQLHELLKENPTDSFLLFALAKEYERMGNPTDALAFYSRLKQANSQYVGLYFHLGKLLEEQGKGQEALQIYEEGIQLAISLSDIHAKAELLNAKTNLELDLE